MRSSETTHSAWHNSSEHPTPRVPPPATRGQPASVHLVGVLRFPVVVLCSHTLRGCIHCCCVFPSSYLRLHAAVGGCYSCSAVATQALSEGCSASMLCCGCAEVCPASQWSHLRTRCPGSVFQFCRPAVRCCLLCCAFFAWSTMCSLYHWNPVGFWCFLSLLRGLGPSVSASVLH